MMADSTGERLGEGLGRRPLGPCGAKGQTGGLSDETELLEVVKLLIMTDMTPSCRRRSEIGMRSDVKLDQTRCHRGNYQYLR